VRLYNKINILVDRYRQKCHYPDAARKAVLKQPNRRSGKAAIHTLGPGEVRNVQGESLKAHLTNLLLVFSHPDLVSSENGEAAMCKIIDMKTRRVITETAKTLPGIIDVYTTRAGKIRIDACVPLAVAVAMLGAAYVPSYVGSNGMTAFDVALIPPVAERALDHARLAGVSIRR
jgi:hypothetical protein